MDVPDAKVPMLRKSPSQPQPLTIFRDSSSNLVMMTRSALGVGRQVDVGDSKCFLVNADITSASHNFFTGQYKLRSKAGTVERFEKKYLASD